MTPEKLNDDKSRDLPCAKRIRVAFRVVTILYIRLFLSFIFKRVLLFMPRTMRRTV